MLAITNWIKRKNTAALPFSVTKQFTAERVCSFSRKTQRVFNIYRDFKIDVVEETWCSCNSGSAAKVVFWREARTTFRLLSSYRITWLICFHIYASRCTCNNAHLLCSRVAKCNCQCMGKNPYNVMYYYNTYRSIAINRQKENSANNTHMQWYNSAVSGQSTWTIPVTTQSSSQHQRRMGEPSALQLLPNQHL